MESGSSVRKGLFAACEKLPGELASVFKIDGEPTAEQRAQMEAFAAKAEGLRSASVLLTTRAKLQQAACAAIVDNVANYEQTVREVRSVDGKAFKPENVNGATAAVCIIALQTAVDGLEDDLSRESHGRTEEIRETARQRMQARYDLLAYTQLPRGLQLSTMSSKGHIFKDDTPFRSAAEMIRTIKAMPNQLMRRESKFFALCQKTLRDRLAVPDYVSTNLLLEFFDDMDEHVFEKMTRGAGDQGVHAFLVDLSPADRAPVERLLHREETLRRESALNAGMTIRREGEEFVLTLSPEATGKMGASVREALVGLENAASGEGQYRDGLELHFENGQKCAEFMADLLSGELDLSSFYRSSGIDLLARNGGSLEAKRVHLA